MLEKFLAEVHVPPQIEVNALDAYMGAMLAPSAITFSEEDLPEMSQDHNNALFITLRCRGNIIPKVLIDGGSGVNILPLSLAQRLGIMEGEIPPSNLFIRAFDGAKRQAVGEIPLEIQLGPATFITLFQILDTQGSFNMLLGRPWIHKAGAIPSTLHQMVKFPYDGKLVSVKGEYEIPICADIEMPYIGEPTGEPSTTQTFEMVNMIRREPDFIDKVSIIAARYLLKKGYKIGRGLGAQDQGDTYPLHLKRKTQHDTTGLGHNEPGLHEAERSLKRCKRQGYPNLFHIFTPSTGNTLEGEQLADAMETLDVNFLEEASEPSAPQPAVEG